MERTRSATSADVSSSMAYSLPSKRALRLPCLTARMSTPLRMTFARLCRDTRTRLDVTQLELARSVGVSRSHICRDRAGRVDPSLDLAWAIADRLGVDLQLVGGRDVIDTRRGDLVHARCSGFTNGRLQRAGWSTARESEVVGLRTHGWIDLLAFDPISRTLVIIELKTRLDDIGAIEREITWYEREAYNVATSMGWRPRRTVAGCSCLHRTRSSHRSRSTDTCCVRPSRTGRPRCMRSFERIG